MRKLNHKSMVIFVASFGLVLILSVSPVSASELSALMSGRRGQSGVEGVSDIYTAIAMVDQDSYVQMDHPDQNYDGGPELVTKIYPTGKDRRSLLRFDLSTIPPGSTVTNATAHFFVTKYNNEVVDIHRVSETWDEVSVTWNNIAEAYDPAVAGTFTPSNGNQFVSADITGLVQDWMQGIYTNDGIMLIGTVDGQESKYASKDANEMDRHAFLEVVVDNPGLVTVADDFDPNADFSGNDGSQIWSSVWLELGEADGTLGGLVQVTTDTKCSAGYCLRLGEGTMTGLGVSREADLSNAVAATLSYKTRRYHSKSGSIALEVSDGEGGSWQPLKTYYFDHDDKGSAWQSVDISPYVASQREVRFVGSGDVGRFFVDDVSLAYVVTSSGIGNRVWDDINRDGIQDVGEPGVAGVAVRLYNSAESVGACADPGKTVVAADVTDSDGGYIFPHLPAGAYCVVVDAETLPASYTATSNNRSPFDVVLGVDELYTGADFGYTIAYADDRLTVSAFAPCTDISWLQQYAQNHNAVFLNEDYSACNFTLGVAAGGELVVANNPMTSLMSDVENDPNTRQSSLDVFVSATFLPNDPDYSNPSLVYAPQQINAEGAWDLTRGDSDLIIAVLDTGIDLTHPEFAGRLLPGWDFVNDDDDPSDDQGHGTHVAGIIAAGINNGIGMAGMAGEVKILPVKVLDAGGTGWWSDIAAGVSYAVDQGAKVINLSLAGTTGSSTLRDAISYAHNKDVTIIVSAGNEGSDIPVYPAAYDEVLSFGATSYDGLRWSLSNYGSNVDVLAPGGLVWSTYWSTAGDTAYQYMSGTSMASPHGAGVAALMYSRDPNIDPEEIKNKILTTATDMGDPGVDSLHGVGLVNAYAAVLAVPTPDPGDPPPVSAIESEIIQDLSGNGIVDPGDTIRFTVQIINDTGADWNNVIVSSAVPEHTSYVERGTQLNGIQVQDDAVQAFSSASSIHSISSFPLDEAGLDTGGLASGGRTSVSFDVFVNMPPPLFHNIESAITVQTDLGPQQFVIEELVGGTSSTLDFTDANGAPVDIFLKNGSIYITVADDDENTNADSLQSITALLVNLSQDDFETITLTETGNDKGVFMGSIPSSSTSGQSDEDGTLYAISGDTLEAIYTDSDFSPDTQVDSAFIDGPGSANLQMTLSVNEDEPDENETIAYTVKVKNNGGPNAATHLVVSDLLPSGLSFSLASASQGSYDEVSGMWYVGTLRDGDDEQLTIIAQVDPGTSGVTINNSASVFSLDQTDPIPDNNTASVSVTVNPADLSIQKDVNEDQPREGETIVYTVKVKNQGPAAFASGIKVRDVLPAGVTFVSASATQGDYHNGTGLWDVGSLADGVEKRLTIYATVDPGTAGMRINNTASVYSFDQTDNKPDNDSEGTVIHVKHIDLLIQKSVNDAKPDEGQNIIYTLQLTNSGPTDTKALNVVVHEKLPAGVTFISAKPNDAYDEVSGLWTVGDVDRGDTTTLTINASVDAGTSGTSISNTANIQGFDQIDEDPSNDVDNADILVNTVNLQVNKTVDVAAPDEGQEITYTITVKNLGPSAIATGIKVSDELPSGLTLLSAAPDVGDYNAATGVWIIGDFTSIDQEASLIIIMRVDAGTRGTTITSTARLLAVDQVETNTGNNTAEASIQVGMTDLRLTKSVDESQPGENQIVVYTLKVENRGPTVLASGVIVEDRLPDGVTFVSADAEQGRF